VSAAKPTAKPAPAPSPATKIYPRAVYTIRLELVSGEQSPEARHVLEDIEAAIKESDLFGDFGMPVSIEVKGPHA